jgi:hypothetical protein
MNHSMEQLQTNQAEPHVNKLRDELHSLVEHLRRDAAKVTDAKAAALFETSAEVLAGLERAFSDYGEKKEAAWQK